MFTVSLQGRSLVGSYYNSCPLFPAPFGHNSFKSFTQREAVQLLYSLPKERCVLK